MLKTRFPGCTCANVFLRGKQQPGCTDPMGSFPATEGRSGGAAPVCPHVCPSASELGAEVWAEGWGARQEMVMWVSG